jgi:predicted metalloprotease with PDZ domain
MKELTGNNGTVVTRHGNTDSINIVPASGEVNFTYTLTYDSISFSDNTYAPNVGEDHLHFAFCQWMLPITEREKALEYSIHIDKLPDNWIPYSSVSGESQDILFKGSLYKSFSMIIGAGKLYKKSYSIQGNPLNVYIIGSYVLENERIAELVYKIVTYQHTWFNDFNFKFYNVAILPKEGNVAGISIPNMFLCHVKKDVEYQKLAWLMSHEMLHKWVGNQIAIKDTTSFELRHQWFKEGINDYLSYLILLDSKLFTRDEFIHSINIYIKNIKENPYADASEDSINKVVSAGKYGVAATKLPYYKGGLIGFMADKEFLKETETGLYSKVKELIIRLYKIKKLKIH